MKKWVIFVLMFFVSLALAYYSLDPWVPSWGESDSNPDNDEE